MKAYLENRQGIPTVDPLSKKRIRIPGLKWTLVMLPVLYIFILLIFSLFGILKLSFINGKGFTLEYFSYFFSQDVYMDILIITFKTSFYVTMSCLLLGYPVAYLLTKMES